MSDLMKRKQRLRLIELEESVLLAQVNRDDNKPDNPSRIFYLRLVYRRNL